MALKYLATALSPFRKTKPANNVEVRKEFFVSRGRLRREREREGTIIRGDKR